MAFESVSEILPQTSAYRRGELVHTRTFRCIGSPNGQETSNDARTAPGIPAYASTWNGAFALDISVEQLKDRLKDNKRIFTVTVNYTNNLKLVNKYKEDPLARDPEITWNYDVKRETYFKDVNDKRVVNTVGDTFEKLPERFVGYPYVEITINQATYDPVAMDAYKFTTNADEVEIDGVAIAAGVGLLCPVAAEKQVEGNGSIEDPYTTYWKVHYKIMINVEGWKDQVENRGYYERTGADYHSPIYEKDNPKVRVSKPMGLKQSGYLCDNNEDPYICEFQPYESKSWADLEFA